MKEQFIERAFRDDTLEVIKNANRIISNYASQGYTLTLRQLYYRFIALDWFPYTWIDPTYNRKNHLAPGTKNTPKNYKRLGSIINDARLAGLIDWDAIEDRTRALRSLTHWTNPEEILWGARNSFRLDKWLTQDFRVEVWVEKDALVGVLERVCNRLDVPYYSCRGYGSQSEMYAAAQRLRQWQNKNYEVAILHLGDHDPSGIDMTRDVIDRLTLFMGEEIEVQRLALNWDQVEQYAPPPNPAKETDARFASYQDKFGDESWELDSLEPQVIDTLIESAILQYCDTERWDIMAEQEEKERNQLDAIAQKFDEVTKFLGVEIEEE